jgi:hypothetical protein
MLQKNGKSGSIIRTRVRWGCLEDDWFCMGNPAAIQYHKGCCICNI